MAGSLPGDSRVNPSHSTAPVGAEKGRKCLINQLDRRTVPAERASEAHPQRAAPCSPAQRCSPSARDEGQPGSRGDHSAPSFPFEKAISLSAALAFPATCALEPSFESNFLQSRNVRKMLEPGTENAP